MITDSRDQKSISCSHCGSTNILPFETEDMLDDDPTFTLVILSAFSIITAYTVFLISTYLFFPVVILIAIYFSTRFVTLKERKREAHLKSVEFVCLECNNSFIELVSPFHKNVL